MAAGGFFCGQLIILHGLYNPGYVETPDIFPVACGGDGRAGSDLRQRQA